MAEESTVAVPTVTIPVDEYFELRQKAEMNAFLLTDWGRIRDYVNDIEHRVIALENKCGRC